MKIVTCPNCAIRVALTKDSECPSCRRKYHPQIEGELNKHVFVARSTEPKTLEQDDAQQTPYKYDLFISYSTDSDYKLARTTESFLEGFDKLPTRDEISLPAINVCIDGTEFSLPRKTRSQSDEDQVWRKILEYLSQSAELLVLCSRNSRDSKYVQRELDWFLKNRGRNRIRIGVTDGIDPSSVPTEVFSAAMIQAGLTDGIWYDFRAYRKASRRWTKVRDFDDERTRLASDLIADRTGKSAGEIRPIWFREKARKARRRWQIALVFLVSLTLLSASLTIATFIAVGQWREVSRQKTEVTKQKELKEKEARASKAAELAARSDLLRNDRPRLSVLLAVEATKSTAIDGYHLPSAEQALRESLSFCSGIALRGHASQVNVLSVGGSGKELITGSEDNTLYWNLENSPAESIRLPGANDSIAACAFSNDGSTVVTGGHDTVIRVWHKDNSGRFQNPKSLQGHKRAINSLSLSHDGQWLLSGSDDGSVRLWDLASESSKKESQILRTSDRDNSVGADIMTVAISPDGMWAFSGGMSKPSLWKLGMKNGKIPGPLHLLEEASIVSSADFSADSKRLATVDAFVGTVHLWTVDDDKPRYMSLGSYPEAVDGFHSLSLSDDGKWLALGGKDTVVRLWNILATDPVKTMRTFSADGSVLTFVAISPKGRWLAAASYDGSVRIWDIESGVLDQPIVLRGHERAVSALRFSNDGELLISGGVDASVRIWPMSTPSPHNTQVVLAGTWDGRLPESSMPMTISRDGKWMLTRGHPMNPQFMRAPFSAFVWDLRNPRRGMEPLCLLENRDSTIFSATITSDSSNAVLAGHDGTLTVCKLNQVPNAGSTVHFPAQDQHLTTALVAANKRPRVFLGNSEGQIISVELDEFARTTKAHRDVWEGHEVGISAMAIDQQDNWLVTGALDGGVRVWDLKDATPAIARRYLADKNAKVVAVTVLKSPEVVAAGSEDGTVQIWRGENQTNVFHKRHSGPVKILKVSSDGNWLVSASWHSALAMLAIEPERQESVALLWDLRGSGKIPPPVILRGHQRPVVSAAFSPDAARLATGSQDGSTRIWNLGAPALAQSAVVLRGAETHVTSLLFSDDGKTLIVCGPENYVFRHAVEMADLVRQAKEAVGRDFTDSERSLYLRTSYD